MVALQAVSSLVTNPYLQEQRRQTDTTTMSNYACTKTTACSNNDSDSGTAIIAYASDALIVPLFRDTQRVVHNMGCIVEEQ